MHKNYLLCIYFARQLWEGCVRTYPGPPLTFCCSSTVWTVVLPSNILYWQEEQFMPGDAIKGKAGAGSNHKKSKPISVAKHITAPGKIAANKVDARKGTFAGRVTEMG